jgi:hypothetical protein
MNPEFQITPTREYLILGLQFAIGSDIYGTGVLFDIEDDAGRCVSVPSSLFEITDATASKWWLARQNERGWFKLWPEEFYTDYFHDDLSEDVAVCVRKFQDVKQRLESEAAERMAIGVSHKS